MSEWQIKTLNQVIDKFIDYRGKTPTKTQNGIPLITAKIVKDGRLLEANEFIAEDNYDAWMTRGLPEYNDVVLTVEAPLGQVALIKDINVALAQRIITLRGKKDTLENVFLKYWLQSDVGQYELDSRASGTTVFGIKASVLKQVPLPIPPLPEQQAIASVLSSLDDKIDLLHRQNKTLEAMAETLFRQWFIEEAKDDWEEILLGDHVQLINGVSYKSSELNPSKNALVTLKNFARNGGIRTDGFKEFTGSFKDTQLVFDKDIVVAHTDLTQDASLIGNPIYVMNLNNYHNLIISMDLVKVNLKSNLLSKNFIFHLLKNSEFKDHALANSNGSSVIHLSKKAIPSFKFKIRDKEQIVLFTQTVAPIEDKVFKNIEQIQILENLRDTLLPKLMSGEIRVQH